MYIKCTPVNENHPFYEALKNLFNSGGVHCLVFGMFGKTIAETKSLIKKCAKYAAAWIENSNVTPLNDMM